MDSATRGQIDEALDYIFEEQNFLETVNWILEADDEVRSQEDLVLGYFLGSSMRFANDFVRNVKVVKKIDKKHEKNVEKRLGKEEARKIREERETRAREERAKGGRPLKVSLTEKETNDIRSMLLLRIKPFREKIRKERALRGLHT